MDEQQALQRSLRRWRRGAGASQPPPLLARLSLFGSKNAEGKCPDGPMLSKSEFMEKVRQSNQACHEGDFRKAIVLYGEALSVDPQNCVLYSNRSAVYVKTQQYHEALDDAIRAQLLNPKWPKRHKEEAWNQEWKKCCWIVVTRERFLPGVSIQRHHPACPGISTVCQGIDVMELS